MQERSLRELLNFVGCARISDKTSYKENTLWVMGTCPLPDHPETRPSFGASTSGIFNCFGCQTSGSLIELIMRTRGYSLKKAIDIYSEYGGGIDDHSEDDLIRYQDLCNNGKYVHEWNGGITVDKVKMALMKSGKSKIPYLLDRGFTKETLMKFKIGYDADSIRFTIPILGLNDDLFGFIRGALLPQKINNEYNDEYYEVYGEEPKYLIDSSIVKSKVLYPLPHYIHNGTVILVEGCLDAAKNHQNKLPNTLSIINAEINAAQIELLKKLKVRSIISMLDDDDAGHKGRERIIKLCRKDFSIYTVEYPNGKSDAGELSYNEAQTMIENKSHYQRRGLFFLK